MQVVFKLITLALVGATAGVHAHELRGGTVVLADVAAAATEKKVLADVVAAATGKGLDFFPPEEMVEESADDDDKWLEWNADDDNDYAIITHYGDDSPFEEMGGNAVLADVAADDDDALTLHNPKYAIWNNQNQEYLNIGSGNSVYAGGSKKYWYFYPLTSDKTAFQIKSGGNCLDYAYDAGIAYMHPCNGDSNQHWHLVGTDFENMVIKTAYDGKCLDLDLSGWKSDVILDSCDGGLTQSFWIEE